MTTALLTTSAIVVNGLLAGLLFAFVCAVSPAYRLLSDEEFVHGFRAINQAIVRPSFLLVFLGAPVTALAAALVGTVSGAVEADTVPLLWIGAGGSLASLIITMVVNVPLNTGLDRAPIDTNADCSAARAGFESAWNRWNLIRTLASTIAVLGFALALALG
ncbi:anthrone oxygenase family protein [Brevibacterium casei]